MVSVPLLHFLAQTETENMKVDNLRADLKISGVEAITAILLLFYAGAKENPKNSVELIIHAVDLSKVLFHRILFLVIQTIC